MVILSWCGCKYFAGGHGVLLGTINCFVHTIMYFYYFLTAISDSYKKSIWWKKHITQLQMVKQPQIQVKNYRFLYFMFSDTIWIACFSLFHFII